MDKKDDILFESLLAKKRHDELIGVIRLLLNEIGKINNKQEIKNLVDISLRKYPEIIDAIKGIDLKSPDVNVELNQKDVVQSIDKTKESIIKKLDKFIELTKKNWKFTVQRDDWGYIKTVKAEQID